MSDRTVPCDLAAERAVLGAILLERDAILAVSDTLQPDDFYLEKHALVYEAQLVCLSRRTPPDLTTVAAELRRNERLDLIGGLAFLGELDPAGIELAAGALEQTAGLVGGLSLGAPVWLPRRRPRSLALEIHDNRSELADLQSSIAGRLDEAIDWREARPFRAHLTAARLGRGFVREDLVLPVSPALHHVRAKRFKGMGNQFDFGHCGSLNGVTP